MGTHSHFCVLTTKVVFTITQALFIFYNYIYIYSTKKTLQVIVVVGALTSSG